MRRTLILTLTALTTLIPLTPATGATTVGAERTLGQAVSDAMLETSVKTALLTNLGFDALGIEVEARGGDVTLSGTVSERVTAEQSQSIAKSVDGVTSLHHRVDVEANSTDTPVGDAVAHGEREVKDALLEGRVKTALLTELGGNAFGIEVEATDGVVSLRGDVDGDEHEKIALDTARRCNGVREVIDLIES